MYWHNVLRTFRLTLISESGIVTTGFRANSVSALVRTIRRRLPDASIVREGPRSYSIFIN